MNWSPSTSIEPAQDGGEPPERVGRRQAREHRAHRRRHLLLQRPGGALEGGVRRRGGHLRLGMIRHEVGEALRVQLVDRLGERGRRTALKPRDLGMGGQVGGERRRGGLERLRVTTAHVEDQRPCQRRVRELARQIRQAVIGAGRKKVRDVVVDAQAQRAEHDHPDRHDGRDAELQPRAVLAPGHFLGSVKYFACSAGV
jgi:hypothetical protein